MKTITFMKADVPALGLLVDDLILDVAAAAQHYNSTVAQHDMQLIAGGASAIGQLEALALQAQSNPELWLQEADIVWGPSVTRPNKLICVGLNYRKHADETNAAYPEYPILFNKFNNTLTGHKHDIAIPSVTSQLDYEVELAIVIGKEAKYVAYADALDYVYGYTIVNDLSARDLQMRTPQWLLGKTCDGFSPLGPYLVSADEVGDPNQLNVRTIVNGDVRQDSNTSDMIFNCAEIVSYISQHMTLTPGDVILTGTPEGVVLGLPEAERVFLQPGDEVVIEIEKLGRLENRFVAEPDKPANWKRIGS
ncbi:fumarylacetoacetate hydrolase family protein [Paenibacillus yanchengensis]|uniref:Fumarylacetoacetate hydrolase family protein n=1 Tax=Paenibacillus yanchengensis TaxID=2035833 RepID=A0ABW4YR64_9BACL